MAEFEELLDDLGAFGPYQRRVFILVSLFETPAAFMMFLPVFIHKQYSWSCNYDNESNLNVHFQNNSLNTGTVNSVSDTDGVLNGGINSSTVTSSSTQYCDTNGLYCDGGENVTFYTPRTTITMDFALCDRDVITKWMMPLQMLGVLLGACLFGQLADTFGRRLVFFIVYSLMLLAGLATAFAPTWEVYTACRFFVGAFFGGTMVINFVLPMEFVTAKWRTFCGCIGFWAVGSMLLAPIAYLVPHWRHLCITCVCLGLPLLLTWWWVPESPRWLIQQGRVAEATRIITQIAKYNNKPIPDPDKLERISCLDAFRRRERKKYSYWDLFRNCNMTKNTLIIIYSWFVSSAVYYGTSFNVKSLSGNMYFNFFLLGLAEIPAVIFVVVVNNKFGRKKTVSFLMLVAGLSCFVIVFLYILDKDEEKITLAFAMLGKFGIAGAWAAAQVFSAELFPTVVRNIGVGASSMAARLGGITAPVIVDMASQPHRYSLSPLPFAIFGCLAFACGVLCFFLPETLNRPLPDSLPPRRGCCKGCQEEQTEEMKHYVEDVCVPVTPQNGAGHMIDNGTNGFVPKRQSYQEEKRRLNSTDL